MAPVETPHRSHVRPGAVGLAPWESLELPAPEGSVLRIKATPARHGPAHADRGPVIGFVLAFRDELDSALYLSGDAVWDDGVCDVSECFSESRADVERAFRAAGLEHRLCWAHARLLGSGTGSAIECVWWPAALYILANLCALTPERRLRP